LPPDTENDREQAAFLSKMAPNADYVAVKRNDLQGFICT
jgi:hypothetical protein